MKKISASWPILVITSILIFIFFSLNSSRTFKETQKLFSWQEPKLFASRRTEDRVPAAAAMWGYAGMGSRAAKPQGFAAVWKELPVCTTEVLASLCHKAFSSNLGRYRNQTSSSVPTPGRALPLPIVCRAQLVCIKPSAVQEQRCILHTFSFQASFLTHHKGTFCFFFFFGAGSCQVVFGKFQSQHQVPKLVENPWRAALSREAAFG